MGATTAAYIWGTICVAVICSLALVGAITLPLLHGKSRSRWMQLFIAMAVGTLSSNAIFHLMPEVLGVHKHGEVATTSIKLLNTSESNGNTDGNHNDKTYLLKMGTIMLAVYGLYVFEFTCHWAFRDNKQKQGVTPADAKVNPMLRSGGQTSEKTTDDDAHGHGHGHTHDAGAVHHHPDLEDIEPSVCYGFRTVAFMILIGHAIHNFVDGLAIGATFAVSNSAGLSTAIAIGLHELPHEIGNFAVLVDSQLSVTKALLANFVSATPIFVGFYLGLAAGQEETVVPYLLCLTIGVFLYVGWIDMLTHLKLEANADDPWYLTIGLHSIGFFIGFIVIFNIAWFDEDLANLLN